MSPESIKKWLAEVGRDREWLAHEIGSKVPTVNGWLSSGRPIPSTVVRCIELLQARHNSINPTLDYETYAAFEELARNQGKSVSVLMGELIKEAVRKAAEGKTK